MPDVGLGLQLVVPFEFVQTPQFYARFLGLGFLITETRETTTVDHLVVTSFTSFVRFCEGGRRPLLEGSNVFLEIELFLGC